MHHILVVGLNTYRWPKDVPFSYSRHPEIMERYWQTCIDAFKDKEVVWTVGYRGKHDRPFWKDEKGRMTPEAAGAVITQAIAKQVELIRKVQPEATIVTNLWAEGAELHRKGHLRLPEGVTVVWPDDGAGLIRDKGKVASGQGIYYHTAMLSRYNSNQLTESVNPGRIYNEVGRFVRAGATEFFLVNVSDIRPVPLSTDCAMKFVWNADPYLGKSDRENMDAFLLDWSRRQFGPEIAPKVADLYNQYFAIPYLRRDQRMGENPLFWRLRSLHRRVARPISRGEPLSSRARRDMGRVQRLVRANRPHVADLLAQAKLLAEAIPADRGPFYQSHVLTPIAVHGETLATLDAYCRALEAYDAKDKSQAVLHAEGALKANDRLYAALHKAEYGKWSDWYRGDRFGGLEGIKYTRDRLRSLLAYLHGKTPPPVHPRRDSYKEIYEYQEPFAENFPLLYPVKNPRGK